MMKNKCTGSPHCPASQLILMEENSTGRPAVTLGELLATLTLVQWEQSSVSYIDVAFLIMLCCQWQLIQHMLHSSTCLLRTLPKLADNNDHSNEQYVVAVLITQHIIIWLYIVWVWLATLKHVLPSLHFWIKNCCTKLSLCLSTIPSAWSVECSLLQIKTVTSFKLSWGFPEGF